MDGSSKEVTRFTRVLPAADGWRMAWSDSRNPTPRSDHRPFARLTLNTPHGHMEAWDAWALEAMPRASELAQGESIITTQAGVGLYDGDAKVAQRNAGTLILTTHRLGYLDTKAPQAHSAYVRLALIRQTEHYSGFLRSSPKVVLTCQLEERVPWTCHVCGTFHTVAALDGRCTKCGVTASSPSPTERTCRACTYRNSASASRCDICGTSLQPASKRVVCKLSFRQGGDNPFYACLRDTLQQKAWTKTVERAAPGLMLVDAAKGMTPVPTPPTDALADLEALMRRARQMVDLAASLRTQLERRERAMAEAGRTDDNEEASMLQSALVQLGLAAPAVTPDMVRNEREYHKELACELGSVLLGQQGLLGPGCVVRDGRIPSTTYSDTGRGILPLDEVWGLWNRARGVALVSPKTMRAATVFLPQVTWPRVDVRTLPSGLMVLHTPRFASEAFEARVLAYLDAVQPEGRSTADVAQVEHTPLALIRDLLTSVEQETGTIARDECGTHDTQWFRNCILEARL